MFQFVGWDVLTTKSNAPHEAKPHEAHLGIYTYQENLGELFAVVQVFWLKLVFVLHILVIIIVQIAEISQTG